MQLLAWMNVLLTVGRHLLSTLIISCFYKLVFVTSAQYFGDHSSNGRYQHLKTLSHTATISCSLSGLYNNYFSWTVFTYACPEVIVCLFLILFHLIHSFSNYRICWGCPHVASLSHCLHLSLYPFLAHISDSDALSWCMRQLRDS